MDLNETIFSLKPNLSQLLMRTIEQLEDPKYATVPKTHWDELRPSILSKYHCEEGGQDQREYQSERDLSKDVDDHHRKNVDENNDHDDDVCKECLCNCSPPPSTDRCSSSSKSKSGLRSKKSPLSFRAFNWRIQPLWRYCASAVHLHLENNGKQVISKRNTQNNNKNAVESKTQIFHNKTKTRTSPTSVQSTKEIYFDCRDIDEKIQFRSRSFEQLQKSQHKTTAFGIHSQFSMPAFEVLPPLFEERTHSLLYQNSYLLDGVKYDYAASKKSQQQSAKLYMNYMRFLKSINKPTKPTDCDIVFGEAKVIMNPSPHWEGARINWLLNLERKQELRKMQTQQAQRQMHEKRKSIELARIEANNKQKKEPKNAKIKENISTKTTSNKKQMKKKMKQQNAAAAAAAAEMSGEECKNQNPNKQKCKSSFLEKLRKNADRRKNTPKVELMPTL